MNPIRIPQVRLQSERALISVQTKHATQEIRQPKLAQEIRQEEADLHIQTKPGRLSIDQSEAWAEAGLKSVKQLNSEFSNKGYQKLMEGIARRANEGMEQLQIEKGQDPIIAQATRNAYQGQKPFNIDWMPSAFSVKTNYIPGEVDIKIDINEPVIKNTPNKPIMTYTPGIVKTELSQRQALEIEFENLVFRNFSFEISI